MLQSIVLKNFVHFMDRTVIVLNNSQRGHTEGQPINTSADKTPTDSKSLDRERGQTEGPSTSTGADKTPKDIKSVDRERRQTEGPSTSTGADKTPTDSKSLDRERRQTEGPSSITGAHKTPTGSKALDISQKKQTEGQSTNTGAESTPRDNKALDETDSRSLDIERGQTEGPSTSTGADKTPTDSKSLDRERGQTEGPSTSTGADKTPTDSKTVDRERGQTEGPSTSTGADKTPTDSKSVDRERRQTEGPSTSTGADKTIMDSKSLDKKMTTIDSNALNIFVGANFCGKSTVLELIRRCMTDEINVSVTRSYDETMVAYAFCQFYLSQHGEIISGIIRDPERKKMVKVFIYKNRTLGRSKSSDSKTTLSFSFEEQEGEEVFKSIFNKTGNGISDDRVNDILKKIKQSKKKSSSNEPNWKSLEDKFIATFPLRGIGSVQWTRSKRIGKKHKASNYKMASERAEIISTLLSRENYTKLINENDERRIFDFLTYPEVFKFEKVKGKVKVEHNSSQFELLKTSEGIIEAKVVSLLIAHKGIQTLCLEDPDRGMHPQMIERLKTVLYDSARHKTIIVVTHSPFFADSLTLHKTHVFIRNRLYEPYVCSVLNVGENLELSKVADNETLRILLFATKVLLVEGVTDKEVVQSILTYEKRKKFEKRGNSENEERSRENFTGNISTHQIISIGGCENVDRVQAFCEYIDLPCFCLLDRDKVIKKHEDKPTRFWGKRKDNVYIKELEKNYKFERPKNIDDYELEKMKSNLKTTTTLRHYNNISEILNFWQKEKRDKDLEKYIKSLENKIGIKNTELRYKPFEEYLEWFKSNTGHVAHKLEKEKLRTIATYWHKRQKEEDFDKYIDKLKEDNSEIRPSVFWTEKKKEFETYLEKLESNRKTFVWRSGELEDAILSSENQRNNISQVLYSIESTENIFLGSKAQNSDPLRKTGNTANGGQSSEHVQVISDTNTNNEQETANSNESEITANGGQSSKNDDDIANTSSNTGQETTENETLSSTQCVVNSFASEITGSCGQSSKNNDNIEDKNRSSNQNTGSQTRNMPLTAKNLKKKLKIRLDENTRKEFCECLMKVEEIKNFISFLAKEEIKPPNTQNDDCDTPDELNSGHTGFSLNCFSRCRSCCD